MFASFLKSVRDNMKYLLFLFCTLAFISCDKKVSNILPSNDGIADLPFAKAQDAKTYADLILRALKTNRKQPIYDQLIDRTSISIIEFNRIISMYSTGITGRKDWEMRDIYEENNWSEATDGFDYAWLDPKGRLGIQINILPDKTESGFRLKRLQFRSRLDVMESVSIPGGPIDNYKKLEYNWDKK